MAENKYEIIVNDGIVPVEIKNIHGDKIGVFYFNPSDIGIVERYQNIRGVYLDSYDMDLALYRKSTYTKIKFKIFVYD